MSRATAKGFDPRKAPVQARSAATVSALFEASIQVLLTAGYRKFTTTRVAERAGVSVGTLYQYFPNKQALIASVIRRYLDALVATVTASCQQVEGQDLETIVRDVVDAFIAAKFERVDISVALHEPLSDVGGAALVKMASSRAVTVIAATLARCPDAGFEDAATASTVVVTVCSALAHAALEAEADATDLENLRHHMRALVLGYLRTLGGNATAGCDFQFGAALVGKAGTIKTA